MAAAMAVSGIKLTKARMKAFKVPSEQPVSLSDEMAFKMALKNPKKKPVSPSEGTLGKDAVQSLQKVHTSFSQRIAKINKMVTNGIPMDSQALLGVQWEMSTLLMQTDLTNKITSGACEKLDTLVKAQ